MQGILRLEHWLQDLSSASGVSGPPQAILRPRQKWQARSAALRSGPTPADTVVDARLLIARLRLRDDDEEVVEGFVDEVVDDGSCGVRGDISDAS